MTMLQISERPGVQVDVEGGWRTVRRPAPEWIGKSPAELLALAAKLPGNLRGTIAVGGTVELLGEVPVDDGLEVAEERFMRLLKQPRETNTAPSEESLEGLLDSTGLTWTRRESAWVIPATEGLPRELRLQRVPGGVRVEATVMEWDEIGPVETEAVAWFLAAAQADLRFARAELQPQGVRIVSLAETEHLETDLPCSLQAVAAGCRLLEREVRALLVPELAQAYVNFHRRITASP